MCRKTSVQCGLNLDKHPPLLLHMLKGELATQPIMAVLLNIQSTTPIDHLRPNPEISFLDIHRIQTQRHEGGKVQGSTYLSKRKEVPYAHRPHSFAHLISSRFTLPCFAKHHCTSSTICVMTCPSLEDLDAPKPGWMVKVY